MCLPAGWKTCCLNQTASWRRSGTPRPTVTTTPAALASTWTSTLTSREIPSEATSTTTCWKRWCVDQWGAPVLLVVVKSLFLLLQPFSSQRKEGSHSSLYLKLPRICSNSVLRRSNTGLFFCVPLLCTLLDAFRGCRILGSLGLHDDKQDIAGN